MPEEKRMRLTGKDYDHLCPACQGMIDSMWSAIDMGLTEDVDDGDIEAACNMVYDNRLFCHGATCKGNEV